MSGNGKKETQQQENGSKKNEKMESKKESFLSQEMILGLITLKHIFWAYLSFLS